MTHVRHGHGTAALCRNEHHRRTGELVLFAHAVAGTPCNLVRPRRALNAKDRFWRTRMRADGHDEAHLPHASSTSTALHTANLDAVHLRFHSTTPHCAVLVLRTRTVLERSATVQLTVHALLRSCCLFRLVPSARACVRASVLLPCASCPKGGIKRKICGRFCLTGRANTRTLCSRVPLAVVLDPRVNSEIFRHRPAHSTPTASSHEAPFFAQRR